MKQTGSFIFFLFIISGLAAQEGFSLQLEKGKAYYLNTQNVITITEKTDTGDLVTVNTEKGGLRYKVLEILDSLFLLETSFTHLSLKSISSGKESFYSSDIDNIRDIHSTLYRRLTNKPFKVLMRKDYTWKETEGLDSVLLNSYKIYDISDDIKKQVDSILLSAIQNFLLQDAALTAVLYGSEKLIPDEVWTTHYVSEHVVPTYDTCTFYLAETAGNIITVKGSGTVISLPEDIESRPGAICYQLKGDTEIEIQYLKESYWMKYATMKTTMSGVALVNTVGASVLSQVPMTITTDAIIAGWIQEEN